MGIKIGNIETKNWRKLVSTALAAAVIGFSSDMSALAELNKYEADTRGEFGIGSAAQFGSADLKLVLFKMLVSFSHFRGFGKVYEFFFC